MWMQLSRQVFMFQCQEHEVVKMIWPMDFSFWMILKLFQIDPECLVVKKFHPLPGFTTGVGRCGGGGGEDAATSGGATLLGAWPSKKFQIFDASEVIY